MIGKKLANAVAAMACAGALVAGMVLLAPVSSTAQVYSAGNLEEGNICSCPVDFGDCICKFDY